MYVTSCSPDKSNIYPDEYHGADCYILDRQTAIRAGKSFWCRGPGLTPQSSHPDPSQDFPEMQHFPGVQDDYASYLQCQVDLTMTMSNAHDVLYPSRSRSLVLAKSEQYYKFIDDFCESESSSCLTYAYWLAEIVHQPLADLAFFRKRWSKKSWQTYPINECVWISFVSDHGLWMSAFKLTRSTALPAAVHLCLLFPSPYAAGSNALFVHGRQRTRKLLSLRIDGLFRRSVYPGSYRCCCKLSFCQGGGLS